MSRDASIGVPARENAKRKSAVWNLAHDGSVLENLECRRSSQPAVDRIYDRDGFSELGQKQGLPIDTEEYPLRRYLRCQGEDWNLPKTALNWPGFARLKQQGGGKKKLDSEAARKLARHRQRLGQTDLTRTGVSGRHIGGARGGERRDGKGGKAGMRGAGNGGDGKKAVKEGQRDRGTEGVRPSLSRSEQVGVKRRGSVYSESAERKARLGASRKGEEGEGSREKEQGIRDECGSALHERVSSYAEAKEWQAQRAAPGVCREAVPYPELERAAAFRGGGASVHMKPIRKTGGCEHGHEAGGGCVRRTRGVDVGWKGSEAAADVLDAHKFSRGERIASGVGRVTAFKPPVDTSPSTSVYLCLPSVYLGRHTCQSTSVYPRLPPAT
ncbi:hypothetical protein DFH08DRAFT_946419 [Mycena albidolilacea]|uniref:Uncharacterized protein n=1 Tax=Mycena albidolilacea TaxID=1033008 RepID=A0AAD7E6V9_9AGAR|nr:hypothetical protein DFH08DRAFT_946419 [Mycena albidolilacea]